MQALNDLGTQPEFDLLIATSMLDLTTARACIDSLRAVPAVLYFHENQFEYPQRASADADIQLTTIKSAMSAEQLVFNSRWNRETFMRGARALLKKMPQRGLASVVDELDRKSTTLPVPLQDDCFPFAAQRQAQKPIRLLWNHRWEFDKGPQRFENFLDRVEALQPFELIFCGQKFRETPQAFSRILERYSDHVRHVGFAPDRETYLDLMRESDVVVSCAEHEFQGLAVQEAIALGCVPLVPDRLAYREYVPRALRYQSNLQDPEKEAADMLETYVSLTNVGDAVHRELRTNISALSWSSMAPQYEKLIQSVIGAPQGRDPDGTI